MKSTGIIKKLDNAGRIVLPKALRETMNLNYKDTLEIFIEDEKIIYKKFEQGCHFCDNVEENTYYKDKLVCKSCVEEMIEKFS